MEDLARYFTELTNNQGFVGDGDGEVDVEAGIRVVILWWREEFGRENNSPMREGD